MINRSKTITLDRRQRLILAFTLAALGVTLFAQPPAYDLVLRNARIVDGTGSPWYRGDVAVRGDAIVRIAPAIAEPATRVIDVGGQERAAASSCWHASRTRRRARGLEPKPSPLFGTNAAAAIRRTSSWRAAIGTRRWRERT